MSRSLFRIISMVVWLTILFLILINSLYVAAEFAAVGVRRSQVRLMAEEGNSLARALLPYLEDSDKLDRYVAACQVGITLSSLVLGAYTQATLQPNLALLLQNIGLPDPESAMAVSTIIILTGISALQVVLGELVPKSLALQYTVSTALFTVAPMRFSLFIYSWLIAILNGSGKILLKWFGVPCCTHRHIHSPEEIDMLITESRSGGILEPDEHRRLHRALQLLTRPARHIMVPRVHLAAIEIDTPIDEVVKTLINSPYTRLPVYRDTVDNIVGILHTKHFVQTYLARGGNISISDVMRPAIMIAHSMKADQLLALLRKEHAHQAVVLDEYGGIEGIVALEDILADLMGRFEDELKSTQNQPELLPDGRVKLPGIMRIEDSEQWLGILWSSQAATVGGHVLEALGHVPVPGETIEIEGVKTEVAHVSNNAIDTILATPLEVPGESGNEETGNE